MTRMITLTKQQKQDLIVAINNPKFILAVIPVGDMRQCNICDKKNNLIYSIDAYNTGRRIIRHYNDIIADTQTFGNNIAELRSINYILSLLIDTYNRRLEKSMYRHR